MRIFFLLFFFLLMIISFSCKKQVNPNPYSGLAYPDTTQNPDGNNLDPSGIAGLHQNIFGKTCANSGCHDGTFEPDFRTIESTYNSLVLQTPIKNTEDNEFGYRVKPFDADKSILLYRLTVNLGGNSGIMPLRIDEGNDWNEKKDEYIANIREWISRGAPDMLGKVHTLPNKEPTLHGVMAFADGTSVPHVSNNPLSIPASTKKLELWFAISDDSTDVSKLEVNEVKFSRNRMENFSKAKDTVMSITATPLTGSGYYGGSYQYYHKVVVDSTFFGEKGDVTFLRVYVKDTQHEAATEIPESGTYIEIKTYTALRIE